MLQRKWDVFPPCWQDQGPRGEGPGWAGSKTSPVALLISMEVDRAARLGEVLAGAGFSCRTALGDLDIQQAVLDARADLIVIEGVRRGEAIALCGEISQRFPTPIIVVEEQGDVFDRVIALEMGADDCLVHPVHDRELIARARALLRRARTQTAQTAAPLVRWSLDRVRRRLTGPASDSWVNLTSNDLMLLALLIRHAGNPVLPQTLATETGMTAPNLATFRTMIVRLRKKMLKAGFENDGIETLHRGGYVLDPALAAGCTLV